MKNAKKMVTFIAIISLCFSINSYATAKTYYSKNTSSNPKEYNQIKEYAQKFMNNYEEDVKQNQSEKQNNFNNIFSNQENRQTHTNRYSFNTMNNEPVELYNPMNLYNNILNSSHSTEHGRSANQSASTELNDPIKLYDADNKVAALFFSTKGNGYIIVNVDDNTVTEFSTKSDNKFITNNGTKYYYNGPMQYMEKENGAIINSATKDKIGTLKQLKSSLKSCNIYDKSNRRLTIRNAGRNTHYSNQNIERHCHTYDDGEDNYPGNNYSDGNYTENSYNEDEDNYPGNTYDEDNDTNNNYNEDEDSYSGNTYDEDNDTDNNYNEDEDSYSGNTYDEDNDTDNNYDQNEDNYSGNTYDEDNDTDNNYNEDEDNYSDNTYDEDNDTNNNYDEDSYPNHNENQDSYPNNNVEDNDSSDSIRIKGELPNYSYNPDGICGTTASAMLLGYYDAYINNDYIPSSLESSDGVKFIKHLAPFIDGSNPGSTEDDVENGIQEYLSEQGIRDPFHLETTSEERIMSAVKNNKPYVLGLLDDPEYSDHWVTGYGYQRNSGTTFAVVNNGWGDSDININLEYSDCMID